MQVLGFYCVGFFFSTSVCTHSTPKWMSEMIKKKVLSHELLWEILSSRVDYFPIPACHLHLSALLSLLPISLCLLLFFLFPLNDACIGHLLNSELLVVVCFCCKY